MHSLHSLQRPAVVLSLEMVGRPMRTIAPRVPPGNPHAALPFASTLEKFIADETEKWGKVIRTANIKPE